MPNSNRLFIFLFLLLISSPPGSPVLGEESSFHRPDPLRQFKPYRGGFDIRNRHYWASAAFTGVHGYATAGVWILGGLVFGIFCLVGGFSHDTNENSERSDAFPSYVFWVVLLFSFFAAAVSGMIFAWCGNFYGRAKKMKKTLISAVGDVRMTIRKVTGAMNETQRLICPYDESTCTRSNSTSRTLQRESETIRRLTFKNRRSVDFVLRILYGTTTAIVAINLVFVVAAIVVLLLNCRTGFIVIIFICWILTALCWLITGFHFFVHTFTDDVCWAFEQFKENPNNYESRFFLPCLNETAADLIMMEIGRRIHDFILEVNSKIEKVDGMLGSLMGELEGNSVRRFRQVCDPFSGPPSYRYDPGRCSNSTLRIGDVPTILERLTCPGDYDGSTGICKEGRKFLSEASFGMARAYTLSTQGLLDVFPDLQSLAHCTSLKETFSTVLADQCVPLRTSIWTLWAFFLSLSTLMIFLQLSWIFKARQRRGQLW